MSQSTLQAPNFQAWNVSDSDFPTDGSDEEKLRFALNYAILAPSIYNTQPWKWKVNGNEVELYADRSRHLPVSDPEGRELLISCGASLEMLQLALRAFDCADITILLPEPDQNNLLARVRLAGHRVGSASDKQLFQTIQHRHTNRQVFDERVVPSSLLREMEVEARQAGAALHCITDVTERRNIVELIVRGAIITSSDADYRRERAHWMRANHSTQADGIPGRAMGLNEPQSVLQPLLMSILDGSEAQADHDWLLAGGAPALAVLSTEADTPRHWIAAGQALARVLLRAGHNEIVASFFNTPIEIAGLWPKLRALISKNADGEISSRADFPQLLFRLGYAETVLPTPRRALNDVILNDVIVEN